MPSDGLLVTRDGSDMLVELPTDPFSGINWSNLSWSLPPLAQGTGRHAVKQKGGQPSSEMRVSNPVAASLTPDDAEGDLRAFIRDQGASFDIVHFVCGFKPGFNERYDRAELFVALGNTGFPFPMFGDSYSSATGDSIAWSMQPLTRTAGGDRTTTVRIGADFKFINFGIDQSRQSHDHACIEARGELGSSPYWTIKRTQTYKLDCDERFALIVRRKHEVPLKVRLRLRAYGTRGKVIRNDFDGEAESSLLGSR